MILSRYTRISVQALFFVFFHVVLGSCFRSMPFLTCLLVPGLSFPPGRKKEIHLVYTRIFEGGIGFARKNFVWLETPNPAFCVYKPSFKLYSFALPETVDGIPMRERAGGRVAKKKKSPALFSAEGYRCHLR